jgi:hypothetical protein
LWRQAWLDEAGRLKISRTADITANAKTSRNRDMGRA